jgi:hypothetical protein
MTGIVNFYFFLEYEKENPEKRTFFVKKLALMRHGVMRLTDKVGLKLGRLQARTFQRDSRGRTRRCR